MWFQDVSDIELFCPITVPKFKKTEGKKAPAPISILN